MQHKLCEHLPGGHVFAGKEALIDTDRHAPRLADMNLYVSNLPYTMTDEEFKGVFAAHGQVSEARIVKDRESGRSRGFGFVEMPVEAEALTAINSVNGQDVSGRQLRVVEARPKEDRPPRGGRGGQHS